MSGLFLLVPLVLGSGDPTWEAGPGGQLFYTIEIEDKYLTPLREGQAVVIPVEEKDRGLRRFQVFLGERSSRRDSTSMPNRTMVSYGWRSNEAGGVDFMIQMSPERLETLAAGTPIVDSVAPEVVDIRRIYVFAGVGELPQESPNTPLAGPPLLAPGTADRSVGGSSSSVGSLQTQGSRFGARDNLATTRSSNEPLSSTVGNAIRGGTVQSSDRSQLPQDNWRHNGAQQQSNWQNERGMPSDQNNPIWDRTGVSSSSGRFASTNGSNQTAFANSQPGRNDTFPRQTMQNDVRRPDTAVGGQQSGAIGGSLNPAATNQAAQQVAAQQAAAAAQLMANQAAAQQAMNTLQQNPQLWPAGFVPQQSQAAGAAQQAQAKESEEGPVKPWTPLILTSLALFASIGGNAYLGWLAWSFYWRYRDAASDIVRAREAVASRQAA